ncbi:uncharacterized protein LOC143511549 [Brachyhypopomus gauderio]|uniref:uncharacterized protein LOC143511549 n=1 Tax=Brachyhypopomus gauderio TaxID=698409 RepID=UPI00404175DA
MFKLLFFKTLEPLSYQDPPGEVLRNTTETLCASGELMANQAENIRTADRRSAGNSVTHFTTPLPTSVASPIRAAATGEFERKGNWEKGRWEFLRKSWCVNSNKQQDLSAV